MKRICRHIILFSFLMIICISLPSVTQAQLGDPGCDPLCNCRADGSICPIDNGLVLLLATGIGYGLLKFRSSYKKGAPVI